MLGIPIALVKVKLTFKGAFVKKYFSMLLMIGLFGTNAMAWECVGQPEQCRKQAELDLLSAQTGQTCVGSYDGCIDLLKAALFGKEIDTINSSKENGLAEDSCTIQKDGTVYCAPLGCRVDANGIPSCEMQ